MVTMPVQEYIKHVWETEDRVTLTEIAKRTGVCWRTARKYAHKEDWNVAEKPTRKRPVMDEWAETVDTWLLEDRLLWRKQRRTAAQIYRDLKALGFAGSERTVREYVSRRKPQLLNDGETPYIKLEHRPGDAQVDFGRVEVVRDGQFEEMRSLTLSFPHSNGAAAVILPGENQECLCEGLKQLFERIGGVPRRLRLDNASAAVAHIGKGELRTLTDSFRRFMLHYRFEAEFCNKGAAHEKGNVENKVGYTRRQWMSPPPTFTDFEAMQELLWEESLADMQRPHYEKGVLIADLWTEDQQALMPLPATPFEAVRVDSAVLNKYGQMRWDGNVYEVPQGKAGMRVLLKIYWDRVEVRDVEQALLTTLERIYDPARISIDWAAHFENYARRPRAVTNAAMFKHLPEEVRAFLSAASPDDRGSRVRWIRDLLQQHPMARVAEALGELSPEQQSDKAALEQKLYAIDPKNCVPLPLAAEHIPADLVLSTPQLSAYNGLQPEEVCT